MSPAGGAGAGLSPLAPILAQMYELQQRLEVISVRLRHVVGPEPTTPKRIEPIPDFPLPEMAWRVRGLLVQVNHLEMQMDLLQRSLSG